MGLEPASWIALGSLALTAVGTFAAVGSANRQQAQQQQIAQQQYAAADAEYELNNKQIAGQRDDVNEVAAEEKSDRMRRAIYELGALQTGVSESGLGIATGSRIEAEAAYAGGVDLSRIESNRQRRQGNLDTQAEQVRLNREARVQSTYQNLQVVGANTQAAKTGAVLGGVGASLQVGDRLYSSYQTQKYRENMEEIARRQRTAREGAVIQ